MKVLQKGVMKRKMKNIAAFLPAVFDVPTNSACRAVSQMRQTRMPVRPMRRKGRRPKRSTTAWEEGVRSVLVWFGWKVWGGVNVETEGRGFLGALTEGAEYIPGKCTSNPERG